MTTDKFSFILSLKSLNERCWLSIIITIIIIDFQLALPFSFFSLPSKFFLIWLTFSTSTSTLIKFLIHNNFYKFCEKFYFYEAENRFSSNLIFIIKKSNYSILKKKQKFHPISHAFCYKYHFWDNEVDQNLYLITLKHRHNESSHCVSAILQTCHNLILLHQEF